MEAVEVGANEGGLPVEEAAAEFEFGREVAQAGEGAVEIGLEAVEGAAAVEAGLTALVGGNDAKAGVAELDGAVEFEEAEAFFEGGQADARTRAASIRSTDTPPATAPAAPGAFAAYRAAPVFTHFVSSATPIVVAVIAMTDHFVVLVSTGPAMTLMMA